MGSVAAGGVEHGRANLGASVAFDGGGNGVVIVIAVVAVVAVVVVAVSSSSVAVGGILANEKPDNSVTTLKPTELENTRKCNMHINN